MGFSDTILKFLSLHQNSNVMMRIEVTFLYSNRNNVVLDVFYEGKIHVRTSECQLPL